MAGLMECPQRLPSLILTVVVIIAGAADYGGVVAQSSGCATSMATLSPCLGYITSNISSSTPSQDCCTALSSVVQGSVMCLCQLFSALNPLGIPINQTRALALPGSCNIATPPLTQCDGKLT
ncbi:non-specific lipid transfer protein GPI-anchored 15 [Cryptomeria japonica]|uniref:non-specific lipid transfer protein GPI-anchored 15 n=1 Tax=Cryptomeria japonica TaxID=3369 RepID=UPI0027D9D9C3|nr:non-specific lipid transfer protein GPI-anchored 15 [Cryptomeria japonica]